MSNDRVIELAKKLKALADRGVGGEKENAIHMLDRLMTEHDISMDDIENPERVDYLFKYQNQYHKQILIQAIGMVMGKEARIFKKTGRSFRLIVACTHAEYLEIEATHLFYYDHFKTELDHFLGAFIQKNNLFAQDAEAKSFEELTPKELERLKRMMKYTNSIDRKTLHKGIES